MKTFLNYSAFTLLVLTIALGVVGFQQFSTPSTSQMRQHFSEHQMLFQQTNEEVFTALSRKTTPPSADETQKAYRWLKIQPAHETYQHGDPVSIHYYTHVKGIGVSAFGTGIAYLDGNQQINIYPTLESMTEDKSHVEGFVGYTHITGPWYSFIWEAD